MNPLLRWFHQLGSPPTFDRFAARWAPWAYAGGAATMLVGLYLALFAVPPDYQQGDSFRILYIHVPSAWMSMAVFALMAVYAAIGLVWRIKLCEILAMACAPAGAAFTLVTLLALPLYVPVLVFGAGSVAAAAQGLDFAGALLMLGAGLALAVVLAPLAAAAAIRIALN